MLDDQAMISDLLRDKNLGKIIINVRRGSKSVLTLDVCNARPSHGKGDRVRKSRVMERKSALHPRADITIRIENVRSGTKAEIG
jgi:hypothetical protein